ncbi:protein of unknown function [Fodinibius roseus]|uniref:DUF4843 domain-containing protein n=1 Tax=Fodinibius roseus TaxID=1194090 RepID=A0A1M5AJM4_9BACT|nr:DUF4843 domain-containing protein [Fodinibius roseus]SHF30336.1 protein of unknown function [Fodinibius roseus]
MKKKELVICGVVLLGAAVFSGCEQEEIMSYDEEYTALNFTADSTTYSFLDNPEDEYVQEITLQVMGDSTGHDRPITLEIIEDSLTTAGSSDYDMMEGVVPAGQFTGVQSIRLYNSEKLDSSRVSLHFRVEDSGDFKPGNAESDDFLLTWTNEVVLPEWRWYSYFFCTEPSSTAYRIIVELTGFTELTRRDVYFDVGVSGMRALGREFGDYIKQYNQEHPDDPLRHEDGPREGELIEPIYYTQSEYD